MSDAPSRTAGAGTLEPSARVVASDFRVADLSLPTFGRREIRFAEQAASGRMATRAEPGPSQPLCGVWIIGSRHLAVRTTVLVETLASLGAGLRWASSIPSAGDSGRSTR